MRLIHAVFTGVLGVCALLIGPIAHAQISFLEHDRLGVEELKEQLDDATDSDRGRLHALLGRVLLDHDPIEAAHQLDLAEEYLAPEDIAGRGYVSSTRCWSELMVGNIADATKLCRIGVTMSSESENDWAIANAHGAETVLHYQQGQLAQASQSARYALDAALRGGRTSQIAKQYNALGLVLRGQGLFQDGLDQFVHGLEMLRPEQDEEMYRILAFNIGLSYADLEQHGLARDFYESTLEWTRRTERYAKELTALIYIALADVRLGAPQRAIESLEGALLRPEMLSNQGYLGFAYAVLGEAYLAAGDLPSSLEQFETGIEISGRFPNTFEQRRLKTGYARALLESGEPETARSFLQETISQTRSENSRQMLLTALDLLAELEERVGNYKEALAVRKETEELARDFQAQTMEHQLALLRADFEFDDNERALDNFA